MDLPASLGPVTRPEDAVGQLGEDDKPAAFSFGQRKSAGQADRRFTPGGCPWPLSQGHPYFITWALLSATTNHVDTASVDVILC